MGGLLHLVQRGDWAGPQPATGRGRSPPRPLLAVPNVTAHPSTVSVPITIAIYDGPLLCGFNVAIKGLTTKCIVALQQQQKYLCSKGQVHRKGKSPSKLATILRLLSLNKKDKNS